MTTDDFLLQVAAPRIPIHRSWVPSFPPTAICLAFRLLAWAETSLVPAEFPVLASGTDLQLHQLTLQLLGSTKTAFGTCTRRQISLPHSDVRTQPKSSVRANRYKGTTIGEARLGVSAVG